MQILSISVYLFRASGHHLTSAVGDCLVVFCLSSSGLRGPSGSSCQGFSGLSLYANVWPQGTIWPQLSGAVWSFCLSILGLKGPSRSNCGELFDHSLSLNFDSHTTLEDSQRFSRSLKIIGGLLRPFKILRGLIMPFKILRGLLGP